MKASVVDLRYRMRDVLKALARNEPVSVLCHGKVAGVIMPAGNGTKARVTDHPFFGSRKGGASPAAIVARLRGGRYRAV